MRVLIADDSDELRRLVADAVVSLGYEVVGESTGGVSAVKAALTLRPDVVVMDWQMPDMDGVAATAAIRAERPEIVVIAYSSAASADVARLFMRAGASAYVTKSDWAGLMAELRAQGDRA
jgi:CheY-like chemotaxis protein